MTNGGFCSSGSTDIPVLTDSSDNLKNLLDDEWSKAEQRLIEKKPGLDSNHKGEYFL
jgi:hypothetical protein